MSIRHWYEPRHRVGRYSDFTADWCSVSCEICRRHPDVAGSRKAQEEADARSAKATDLVFRERVQSVLDGPEPWHLRSALYRALEYDADLERRVADILAKEEDR